MDGLKILKSVLEKNDMLVPVKKQFGLKKVFGVCGTNSLNHEREVDVYKELLEIYHKQGKLLDYNIETKHV